MRDTAEPQCQLMVFLLGSNPAELGNDHVEAFGEEFPYARDVGYLAGMDDENAGTQVVAKGSCEILDSEADFTMFFAEYGGVVDRWLAIRQSRTHYIIRRHRLPFDGPR